MKFSIEKAAGLAALQRVAAIVNTKHTLPILANVLIVADSLGVHFRGSDLDIEATSFVETEVAEPGQIAARADVLVEIFRGADDAARLNLQIADGDARMSVKSGRSRFNVACLPASEFPSFPADHWAARMVIPANVLGDALGAVAYAQARDKSRYILKSVHMHYKGDGITTTATNGHMLAVRWTDLGQLNDTLPPICIPTATVGQMQAVLAGLAGNDVTLSISPNKILLAYDKDTLISKLLDGTYVDYQRVIPRDFNGTITVRLEALATAVRRAMVTASDKSRSLRFTATPGLLAISSRSQEGDAVDEIEAKGDGELIVGFNGSYVLETLGSLPGPFVEIAYIDDQSPTKWSTPGDEHGACVLMPLRV